MSLPKFRAWDESKKQMVPVNQIWFDSKQEIKSVITNNGDIWVCPIMQCIGKKDIYNRDIYVDDIVKFCPYNNEPYRLGIIKWYKIEFTIEDENGKIMDGWDVIHTLFNYSDKRLEIVGNVYQQYEHEVI